MFLNSCARVLTFHSSIETEIAVSEQKAIKPSWDLADSPKTQHSPPSLRPVVPEFSDIFYEIVERMSENIAHISKFSRAGWILALRWSFFELTFKRLVGLMIEMMSVQPPDEFGPCDMVGRLCSHVSLASSSCLGNQEIVFFFFWVFEDRKKEPKPNIRWTQKFGQRGVPTSNHCKIKS